VCKTGHVWNGCGLRPPPYFTPCVCVWVFCVETSVNTYGPEREAESQSARDQSGTAHNKQKKLYIHIIIHLSVIFILFSLYLSFYSYDYYRHQLVSASINNNTVERRIENIRLATYIVDIYSITLQPGGKKGKSLD
jgi:hypothetical protein